MDARGPALSNPMAGAVDFFQDRATVRARLRPTFVANNLAWEYFHCN
jgi:hypothetical protein